MVRREPSPYVPVVRREPSPYVPSHKVRDHGDDSQHKQGEDEGHDGTYFLCLPGKDLDHNPGEYAEHDAVCDGVGKEHHDDGQVRADHVGHIIFKMDLLAAGKHEHAHVDQRRCGGEAGDRQEDGTEDHGDQEQDSCGAGRKSGPSAFGYAGDGLHEAGYRGGSQAGAQGGSDGVRSEYTAGTGELAVFIQKVSLVGNADYGTDGIKEIHEEEAEHDGQEPDDMLSRPGEVELEGGLADAGEIKGIREGGNQGIDPGIRIYIVPSDQLGDHAQDPGGEDSDQYGALYLIVTEYGNEKESHQCKHNGG